MRKRRLHKYRIYKKFTTYLLLTPVIFSLLMLTSCSVTIEAFSKTNLQSVIADRILANQEIVNKLYVSGFISSENKDTIMANIQKQMTAFTTADLAKDDAMRDKLTDAIVNWSAPAYTDGNAGNYKEDEWLDNILTKYMSSNVKMREYMNEKVPLFKGNGSAITPISIIDGKTGSEINEKFGYDVYVLKPFKSTTGDATNRSLDEVVEMINSATTSSAATVNNDIMKKIFQQAKGSDNLPITLLDLTKKENRVVGYSSGSPVVSDTTYKATSGKLEVDTVGNKVTSSIGMDSENSMPENDLIAQPGNDMVIKDATGTIPLMSIRFNEFNKDAVDNITQTIGLNPDQYLFTTVDGENRVYLMEYPVSYISGFKDNTNDATQYESIFKRSNMGLNVRTGKMIKYGSAWGKPDEAGVYFENSDPYLTVKGALNAQDESKASFVVGGESDEDMKLEVGENKIKVSSGTIILRDYLEASYAPGVVSSENLVVFGRKLRILQLSGSKGNVMAKYYDKKGDELSNSANLYVSDFADFNTLNSASPELHYIGKEGEVVSTTTTNAPEGSANTTDYTVDTIKKSLAKIDSLKEVAVPEIESTVQFPGSYIGAIDVDNKGKPLFYAITVKKNMFDTGLFSGWISNTDKSENSLNWWSDWLANTNRLYKYKINTTALEDYLNGNYNYELQKAGVVTLDLDTIAKIQKDYEKQDKQANVKWFRTTFVTFGYGVMAYAFILVSAWILDMNVDLGFNVLGKVSFGHLRAIRDIEDVPSEDRKSFVTFGGIIQKSLIVATVGVILMLVNVADIVILLIKLFGGIAKFISKLFMGI